MSQEDAESSRDRARAHPTRQAILALLSEHGDAGLPSSAICHELPGAPTLSTVAYHLRVLAGAGLVKADGGPTVPVYSLA